MLRASCRGLLLTFVAWNFPAALLVRKLATCLAAGCSCVVKPSPESPFTALAIALLATQAGFAPGVINVVPASHATTPEVGETLCTHPAIKKISFTGSTRVGKLIAKQASSTLKKLTLELGVRRRLLASLTHAGKRRLRGVRRC